MGRTPSLVTHGAHSLDAAYGYRPSSLAGMRQAAQFSTGGGWDCKNGQFAGRRPEISPEARYRVVRVHGTYIEARHSLWRVVERAGGAKILPSAYIPRGTEHWFPPKPGIVSPRPGNVHESTDRASPRTRYPRIRLPREPGKPPRWARIIAALGRLILKRGDLSSETR